MLYVIVVSPFISEVTDMKQQESLVIGIVMKDDYLSQVASRFRLPPLAYSLTADTKYRVELNNAKGKVQTSLIWDIVSPTREILPYIIASGLILLMLSYFIVRRFLFREFNTRAQYEEVLYNAATKDELTKIANRKYFYDQAEYSFKTYRVQNRKYSLLWIDLDHFKEVNDKFGVIAGNFALVHFTKIVQRLLREGDSFGRVGGEAFSIFLPDTDSHESCCFVERIRIELKKNPIKQHEMNDYVIHFSAGLATHELDCTTLAELTNKAGEALYEAKKNGRNITIVARADL